MSEGEVWKDVVGYEGLYMISDQGNIRSVDRVDNAGRKRRGLTLKQRHHKYGYLKVGLCKNSTTETKLMHRIVAEAFIPNPNNYPEVNHKDENKTNNEMSNLEWCNARYNSNYGTRNKKVSKKLSKKVMAVNIKTGEILTFNSTKEAVSEGYFDASRACRGIYGRSGHLYKGHRWSYEEEHK